MFEPSVVEEQVRRLTRKADTLGGIGVVLGLIPGAAIGGFPIIAHGPIPPKYGIATLLLGALLGGVLGYIPAKSRSFKHRLRAQLMLGQLRLEQNIEALLAVSERPVPALPAPAPVQALPEAPRIEEIIQAGLGLPESAPVADVAPTVELRSAVEPADAEPGEPAAITPLPEAETAAEAGPEPAAAPEREPGPAHELVPPVPSWAATLDRVLPSLAITSEPEPAEAVPAPAPTEEPVAAPTWALPFPEAVTDEVETEPEPLPAPTPLPVPEPLRPDFGSTTPAWAAPVPTPAPESDAEDEETAPPAPAAPTDLSSLSIAEIARLADAGSL